MIILKTNLSKKEVALGVVNALRDFYQRNSMPILVGLDESGEVDYWHEVHGAEGMALQIAFTEDDGLWGSEDPQDPNFWDSNFDHMVDWFCNDLIDQALDTHNDQAREIYEEELEIIFAEETQND